LRARDDSYAEFNPTAADVLLLLEVSDSSIGYDKNTKIPLYARAGVPEVWLVDVQHARLEVFRDPSANGYRDITVLGKEQAVAATKVPAIAFFVRALFPPRSRTT
jgi:Uma2 family endonuclease